MSTPERNELEQASASVSQDDPSLQLYAPKSSGGMSLCYGCRRLNHCRLGIENERLEDNGIVISRLVCSSENEGGPEVAHGGWTSAVMDELVGHTLTMNGEFAVTGTLTVVYRRPVPIGWDLVGRAWITRREGRKVFVQATLELELSGALLAQAEAIMIRRPETHFEEHQQWLSKQTGIA